MDNWQRIGLPDELKAGCVLYLPGDVSGTTAFDASGNGNNGTLVNSPTVTRGGLWGYNGLTFNGSNQTAYFNVGNITWDWTFCFTVNSANANWWSGTWVWFARTAWGENTYHYFILWSGTDSERCAFRYYDWSSFKAVQSNPRLSANVNYRIACVKRASSIELYVNGVSQWTTAIASTQYFDRIYLMCARPPYDYASGTNACQYLANRSLSLDEIRLDATTFFTP